MENIKMCMGYMTEYFCSSPTVINRSNALCDGLIQCYVNIALLKIAPLLNITFIFLSDLDKE